LCIYAEKTTIHIQPHNMKFLLFMVAFLCLQFSNAQNNFSEKEKQTDAVAKQLIYYFNYKKQDSAYMLASEAFKKNINESSWQSIFNKQIINLLPFSNLEFKSSKNGILKYKMQGVVPFQLLISTDSLQKFVVFAIQPYQEDARKKQLAATDNSKESLLDKTVDSLASNYINTEGNVALSIAVYANGKDYFYNYGETKKDNKQLPTNKTLYEIGSITKTFTGILLAQAIVEKKVKLTDPIIQFLPDSVAKNIALKDITLAHLSNHSSGLPRIPINMNFTVTNYLQPYENYDDKALFWFLKNYRDTAKPGSKYDYSNLAVGLLGTILERIYKKPFDVLLKEKIMTPLTLNSTKIKLSAEEKNWITQGYNEKGEEVPVWNFKSLAACGALKSNTTDLLQYGKYQLPNFTSSISKAIQISHEPSFVSNSEKVGLGWIYLSNDNSNIIHHSGGTYGCRSLIAINKNKNVVVVVLTNNATNGDALGIRLFKSIDSITQ